VFRAMIDSGVEVKDGVIVLAVNLLGEKTLASTKIYDSEVNAWGMVDSSRLHNDNTVEGYQFVAVRATDINMCYVIEEADHDITTHMLCVDTDYIDHDDYAVYYSTYRPFFILAVPVTDKFNMTLYANNKNQILKYKSFSEAITEFKKTVPK